MQPNLWIGLGLLWGLTACGQGSDAPPAISDEVSNERSIPLTPEDGTTLVLIVGSEQELKLESNPTTGYFWACEVDAGSSVKITDDAYIADPAPEGLVGSGGVQVFTLLGAAAGRGSMTCTYARGPEDIVDQRTFKLLANPLGDAE